ncbi:hypothetical protein OH77DRAFT_1300249 [Trametes cingulata]|nr:hypothetical protein OH77DRAFT_1300249 [Trametes cingulata]
MNHCGGGDSPVVLRAPFRYRACASACCVLRIRQREGLRLPAHGARRRIPQLQDASRRRSRTRTVQFSSGFCRSRQLERGCPWVPPGFVFFSFLPLSSPDPVLLLRLALLHATSCFSRELRHGGAATIVGFPSREPTCRRETLPAGWKR